MSIGNYLIFTEYGGKVLVTQPSLAGPAVQDITNQTFLFNNYIKVSDYNLDVEQTLNIGSQSSGAGAGRITFNPFEITKNVDHISTKLFANCASGTPFQQVVLLVVNETTAEKQRRAFAQYTFKLVAVKTISYASDEEQPKETVSFEYGGLQVRYAGQNPDGSFGAIDAAGWNRVRNVSDIGPTPIN